MGDPYDSDNELLELEEDEDYSRIQQSLADLALYLEDVDDEAPTDTNYKWLPSGNILAPPNVSTKRGGGKLKPGCEKLFETPIMSMLAFLPIQLWKALALFSTIYKNILHETNGNNMICGAKWEGDCTLADIMVTFGQLFKQCLRPTPG